MDGFTILNHGLQCRFIGIEASLSGKRMLDKGARVFGRAEFRYPSSDIRSFRIELFGLLRRIKYPEVRRSIGATPGCPLPPAIVAG